MRVEDRQLVERQGVALVQGLAVNDLRWLFREQAISDVGIDAHLEVVTGGRATGRLLALQIKSGDSYFRESVPDGFIYRGDPWHMEYWINHSLPVVVVICSPRTGDAYWQAISEDTAVRTDGGWTMVIPRANRFGASAAEPLQAVAARRAEQSRLGGAIAGSETVTHPDSILGALLANPQLLATGRCAIKTGSLTYTCSRIASLDDLVAVLVSAQSSDGTVFVLRQVEGRWGVAAQVPISTKYAESVPAFFVPGSAGYCLVVQHPTGWGTGTLLHEERWFLLSRQPRLILEYPIDAYVVGWGLLFDRWIKGERITVPSMLKTGARLDLTMKVKYLPSSDVPEYQGVGGFDISKTIRLEWHESIAGFASLPGSDMAPEETLGLYGDDDAGFVTRNLETLDALAQSATGGLMTWLSNLADRARAEQSEVLRRALRRRTV